MCCSLDPMGLCVSVGLVCVKGTAIKKFGTGHWWPGNHVLFGSEWNQFLDHGNGSSGEVAGWKWKSTAL